MVLVNRYSASASEIVAACLQDHQRAVVIGERTWGKGSVQNVIELENGRSALKLTTASYKRPNGKNIHRFPDAKETDEWGVMPDAGFEVKMSDEEMIELDAAIAATATSCCLTRKLAAASRPRPRLPADPAPRPSPPRAKADAKPADDKSAERKPAARRAVRRSPVAKGARLSHPTARPGTVVAVDVKILTHRNHLRRNGRRRRHRSAGSARPRSWLRRTICTSRSAASCRRSPRGPTSSASCR